MGLYGFAGPASVPQVVAAIEKAGMGDRVTADPNYLVGLLGQSACGSAHGVRPSPFEIEGSAHGVRPSPVGHASEQAASAVLFSDQWAFRQIGLYRPPAETVSFSESLPTGSKVRVGVFDTSPFCSFTGNAPCPITAELGANYGMAPPWDLELHFPPIPVMTPIPKLVDSDIRDHGLFVSGLIHAIAPEADIQLIQVLDEHGCGRLFNLNEALFTFIAAMVNERDSLDGAVINLSLGLQKPRTDVEVEEGEDASQATPAPESTPIAPKKIVIDADKTVLVEDTVESLQQAIELAHERGAVVVSASGNDSWVGDAPLSPHLPAAYPSVIGVAGTNIKRERSCFSNWGDVSAPAGDGVYDEELKKEVKEKEGIETTACRPRSIVMVPARVRSLALSTTSREATPTGPVPPSPHRWSAGWQPWSWMRGPLASLWRPTGYPQTTSLKRSAAAHLLATV